MRKFTKAAAMLCAAAMVIPSASVFAAEDGGASELTEVGTYPISEEPLEFTMFRTNMPNVEDFQTNDFTKYMEDLTNIKFTFEAAARDDRAEKLNMEFNTNTYPDVIMHYAPDAAKWGVEEGILIPLDDLIEANMPNYMEKMGQYLDQMRETDGHIYQLAGLNECYHCQYARKMWVNTHYLEEMGVEVPQTTEEFYEVCKKFVETYPDKIAIGGASSGWYVDFVAWLMGSFMPQDRRAKYVRNALLTLAAVLALGLLALTVRALLGRRRLRQAAARYQDPDCRMGCGYILCAVHDLLGQPGLPEDPLSPEDAEDLVYLEREVWYSGHTMTEDQRRRCLALLESARRVWREQTPALRRFAARFITCKVF